MVNSTLDASSPSDISSGSESSTRESRKRSHPFASTLSSSQYHLLCSRASPLLTANLKLLVNEVNFFNLISDNEQTELRQLLPECDRDATESFITHEFFARALEEYRTLLGDGFYDKQTTTARLSSDFKQSKSEAKSQCNGRLSTPKESKSRKNQLKVKEESPISSSEDSLDNTSTSSTPTTVQNKLYNVLPVSPTKIRIAKSTIRSSVEGEMKPSDVAKQIVASAAQQFPHLVSCSAKSPKDESAIMKTENDVEDIHSPKIEIASPHIAVPEEEILPQLPVLSPPPPLHRSQVGSEERSTKTLAQLKKQRLKNARSREMSSLWQPNHSHYLTSGEITEDGDVYPSRRLFVR